MDRDECNAGVCFRSMGNFGCIFQLVHWIHKHVFVDVWSSERTGTLLCVLFAEIVFWGVFAGILYKLGIYWKL
ncbi:hypothetical protein DsansV1_C19g0160821 [Dioscorea sansibarensis]